MKNKKRSKNQYTKSLNKLYSNLDIIKRSIIFCLAILILDYFNVFSKLIQTQELIFIYLGIIILCLIKFVEFKPWNLLKVKTVNYVDTSLEISRISLVLYMFSLLIFPSIYKTFLCAIFCIIICILEIYRIIIINKIKINNSHNNVYDLKDLYENKIIIDDKLILINENDVNYDLLNRNNVISGLNNIITNCYPNEKFVIALEGSWGSGKTTILNNLKKYINKDEIILIDDFDPWSYEDEKSLFRGMFDAILKNIDVNFSIKNINKFLNTYMDTIFYNSKYEMPYSFFKNYYTNYNETNQLRVIINDYLKNNNKRILFIIDNIERAEKENIIFLFKLINNILNFENTIYLLSFDDEKMKKYFEKELNIDYSYLKKIIQLEIKIPKIDKNTLDKLIHTCINNLFKSYGIEDMNNDYIALISKNIEDLRDFKRYLNSVTAFQYNIKNYLNCSEAFLLEIIKQETPELYNQIQKNKKFFVSQDMHLDNEIYTLNTNSFNQEGKEFFEKLLKNVDTKYKQILAKLFPFVKKFLENKNLREEYVINDKNEYDDSILNKRISNARYFDLYFSQSQNEFTLINTKIENFINVINENNNYKVIEESYIDMISLYKNWIQKFTFEVLEISIHKVNMNKKFILLKLIYQHLYNYDDSLIFFGFSALSRAEVIIVELIQNISNNELEKFYQILQSSNSNLYLLNEMLYWLDTPSKGGINKENISNELKKISSFIINRIINNNVNILDNTNYVRKNIWGFYHATKENEEIRKKYIKSILNEHTIFKFLNDMISRSVGRQYGYTIKDEYINYFSTREEIDVILTNITRTLTDDEKLLIDIYNNNTEDKTLYLDYDKTFNV